MRRWPVPNNHRMAGGGYSFGLSYSDGSYARVYVARGGGVELTPTVEHVAAASVMLREMVRNVEDINHFDRERELHEFTCQEIGR